jgi:hypothetical protein
MDVDGADNMIGLKLAMSVSRTYDFISPEAEFCQTRNLPDKKFARREICRIRNLPDYLSIKR